MHILVGSQTMHSRYYNMNIFDGYVSNWTVLFGKHKNTKFKDVPADYLRWCYERGVCDKNEKVAGYLEARFGD